MSIANFFQRPHYTSEATDFLSRLKRDKPHLDDQQTRGRALLWDKPIDRDLQAGFQAARVPQKAYVYQTAPDAD
ncbi:MAG: DUF3460 family protein [Burkholderiaceae bacterium]|nr:DUF3460 family protein [Burkholderiaceae bacterium]